MTITIILVIIGFIIYWIFIKDGAYKQGVGELKSGDFHKAYGNFHKTIRKNPKHFMAEFHLGLCCKHQAELFKETDTNNENFKIEALNHFLRASEINPNFLKSNNLVEVLIASENNNNLKQEMISITKNKIDKTTSAIKEQYSWLNRI
ncbi:hypothetical protein EC396_11320 [Lutibacter sp. HS1-25]|uniref:tetratricopeptide repeat protein n=1 Tax=Lutibacter sp. HS1-25 TaxID=2485000 RepID=UPI0010116023|nr:hypothetical protein [Lutibacter sp. HS1-25]RXP52353.1 hypothetical protein EC396_11320 [Lutibacter sp. HS1-25]